MYHMQRKISFVEGEYYHIYNRGVDKRAIFSTTADYKRCMLLLFLANSSEDVRIDNLLKTYSYEEIFNREHSNPLVAIGAFCLMPNHFHILATPLQEGGLSKFMLKFQTGYSMYFNTKNERSGSLFQGPFKSEHVADDNYLKYLFSYIHLNPAKIKDAHWKGKAVKQAFLKKFVESYPYSSLTEYINDTPTITDPKAFPSYFETKKDVVDHITDWLEYDQET